MGVDSRGGHVRRGLKVRRHNRWLGPAVDQKRAEAFVLGAQIVDRGQRLREAGLKFLDTVGPARHD
jgi:hypothetical protein